jgi:tellurite resistance protein TerC/cation:H+ antiporter
MEINVLTDSFDWLLRLRYRVAHFWPLRKEEAAHMFLKSLQQTKRFLKIPFGFTLLVLGIIMIVTPGPGWLVIALALGVLAAEFVWARQLLEHMKEQGDRLREHGVRLRNSILSRMLADRA